MPTPLRILLTAFLLVGLHCGVAAASPSSVLEGTTEWSGEVTVAEPITVAPGATLILKPGTRVTFEATGTIAVQGQLKAAGEKARPIRMQGASDAKAFALSAQGESSRLELSEVDVTGAGQAIAIRAGTITSRTCRFTKNGVALVIDARGRAELSDLTFEGNDTGLVVTTNSAIHATKLAFRRHKVGAVLASGAAGSFEDCSFEENARAVGDEYSSSVTFTRCSFEKNETGMELRRTDKGPVVLKSTFSDNKTGIFASLSSHPLVEACRFLGNEVGFSAEGFSNPFLRYCAFSNNGQAIRFYKKSNGRLQGNRLEKNKVALFADFSSYPDVKGNLFLDNDWHVRLGNEQSIDFERRRGSVDLTTKGAKEKAKDGPSAATTPSPLRPGVVSVGNEVFSVAGNAWDEGTEREMGAGPEANITRFWDGKDQEPVSYKGFGEGRYAVDVISFLPFAARETLAVGPEAWRSLSPARLPAMGTGAPMP